MLVKDLLATTLSSQEVNASPEAMELKRNLDMLFEAVNKATITGLEEKAKNDTLKSNLIGICMDGDICTYDFDVNDMNTVARIDATILDKLWYFFHLRYDLQLEGFDISCDGTIKPLFSEHHTINDDYYLSKSQIVSLYKPLRDHFNELRIPAEFEHPTSM